MTTTLDDLIERLQSLRDEISADIRDDDRAGQAEVRLAVQPSYPMQHLLSDREPVWVVDDAGDPVIYLAEAGQDRDNPYLSGEVSELLGWS